MLCMQCRDVMDAIDLYRSRTVDIIRKLLSRKLNSVPLKIVFGWGLWEVVVKTEKPQEFSPKTEKPHSKIWKNRNRNDK